MVDYAFEGRLYEFSDLRSRLTRIEAKVDQDEASAGTGPGEVQDGSRWSRMRSIMGTRLDTNNEASP